MTQDKGRFDDIFKTPSAGTEVKERPLSDTFENIFAERPELPPVVAPPEPEKREGFFKRTIGAIGDIFVRKAEAPVTGPKTPYELENERKELLSKIQGRNETLESLQESLEKEKGTIDESNEKAVKNYNIKTDYFNNILTDTQGLVEGYNTTLKVEKGKLPPLTFYDKWKDIGARPEQLVPYISGAGETVEFINLLKAANSLRDDTYTEKDLNLLQEYITQAERDRTFGYKVLEVLALLPPFAGELYITGGVTTLIQKGTVKGAKKTLSKLLTKSGKRLLEKKIAKFGLKATGWVVARTIQTPMAGISRIAAGTMEKQFVSTLTAIGKEQAAKAFGNDAYEAGTEDMFTSFRKAFGEQWVETLSEFTGGALKPLSRIIKNRLAKVALFSAFQKVNPGQSVVTLQRIINRMGYNGVIGEMYEERVGEIGHGILYELGLGDQKFSIPTIEQLGVELVAFSVPGVGIAMLNRALSQQGIDVELPPEDKGDFDDIFKGEKAIEIQKKAEEEIEKKKGEVVEKPEVPKEPEEVPEVVKEPEVEPEISKELESLAVEAKSVEEFVEKQLKMGDKVKFRSPTMRSTIIEGEFVKKIDDKFIIKTKLAGFADMEYTIPLKDLQLTDFYNKVKGVKEVEPEVKPKEEVIPKEEKPEEKEVAPEEKKPEEEVPPVEEKPKEKPTIKVITRKEPSAIKTEGKFKRQVIIKDHPEVYTDAVLLIEDRTPEEVKKWQERQEPAGEPLEYSAVEKIYPKEKTKPVKFIGFEKATSGMPAIARLGISEKESFAVNAEYYKWVESEGYTIKSTGDGEKPFVLERGGKDVGLLMGIRGTEKSIELKEEVEEEPEKPEEEKGEVIKPVLLEDFTIERDKLRELWGSGKKLYIEDKEYSVHKMSYGEFFIEPFGEERGETEGFAPGTFFLAKDDGADIYRIDFEAEPEIKEKEEEEIEPEVKPLEKKPERGIIKEYEEPTKEVEEGERTGQGIRPGEVSGAVQMGAGQSGSLGESSIEHTAKTLERGQGEPLVVPRDVGVGLGKREGLTSGRLEKKSESERLAFNKEVEGIINSKPFDQIFDPSVYSKIEKDKLREYSGYGGIRTRGEETTGALDEYYTSPKLVRFTYQTLIDEIGLDTISKVKTIVEPSVGTGNFVYNAPFPGHKFTAFEINKYSAVVAKVLNPDIDLRLEDVYRETVPQNFSKQFIKDNRGGYIPEPYADLVVGNPPYGRYAGEMKGLGEGVEFSTFEEYFIGRGLAITKPGGHLAYIVSSAFLRSDNTKGKEVIAKLGTLIKAYRLPNGVFANTQIGTDLVVFKREPGNSDIISNDKYFDEFSENILGVESERRGRFGMEKYVEGTFDNIPNIKSSDFIKLQGNQVVEKVEVIPQVKKKEFPKKVDKAILKKVLIETKNNPDDFVPIDTLGLDDIVVKGFEVTQVDGSLKSEFVLPLTDQDKLSHFSYRKGKWYVDAVYVDSVNLYDVLTDLEEEKDILGGRQYNKQKELVNKNLPKWTKMEEIATAPQSRFWEEIKIDEKSIKHSFSSYLGELPSEAAEGVEKHYIHSFVNNNFNVRNALESEKGFIKKNVARVTNKLFHQFLIDSGSDTEMREVIENAYNRVLNSIAIMDHTAVPVGTKIPKIFWKTEKTLKLNDAQRRAIGLFNVRGKGIGALDVGLGKTIVGVLATAEMFRKGQAKRSLVVVPNTSVGEQWIETIKHILPESTIYDLRDRKRIVKLAGHDFKEKSFIIVTESALEIMSISDESLMRLLPDLKEVFAGDQTTPREQEQLVQDIKEKMLGKTKRGTVVNLEDMGIDHIF